jgi:hypothetical protein
MPKTTCESVQRISIRYLMQHGYRSTLPKYGRDYNYFIQIVQAITNDEGIKQEVTYNVELTTTPCFFGGKRYWFTCPNCKKRVGVLYRRFKYFSCRTCNRLAYRSQQRTHKGRFGILDKLLSVDIDAEEKKIRVKRWRGVGTHRYRRFLKKRDSYMDAEKLFWSEEQPKNVYDTNQ